MTNLDRPIIQKIYKYKRNSKGKILKKEQIGVMVAGPTNDNPKKITFGFSLCHPKYDRFDWIKVNGGHQRKKHFGRELAIQRAIKWSKLNSAQFIPYKIRNEAKLFIQRVKRYYKDKIVPSWIDISLQH